MCLLSYVKQVYLFFIVLVTAVAQGQPSWTLYNTGNSAMPDNSVYCLATDSAHNLWIGSDNGLVRLSGNTLTVLDSSNSGLPVNQIRSLAFDKQGRLWVGTLQAGVAVYDGSNWSYYNTQNSLLPDNQVRSIAFDSSGYAWLGTGGGVANINDEGWAIYNMGNSPLMANNINSVYIDRNDVKWVGTVNGGISIKEGSGWTTYTHMNSGLLDNTVFDITEDLYGNAWFATPAQGLGRFNNGVWYYRTNYNSALPTNSLTCVRISQTTDVKYIGTIDKGLVRWNNGLQFDSFTVHNSPMPDNHVNDVLIYNDTTCFIATATGGLVKFTDTTRFVAVGINEAPAYNTLRLFPNPASTFLKIEIPVEHMQIQLLDITGRVWLQTTYSLGEALSLAGLPAGYYVVVGTSSGTAYRAGFVKE